MPKVVPNRRYSAEFKVKVIETMRAEGLNYSEAGRRFGIESHTPVSYTHLTLPTICSV